MTLKRELLLVFVLSCFISAYSEYFDYFWHVQQWPPSVCSGVSSTIACPASHLERFVISGFWPEYENGTFPIDCNGPPYHSYAIESLRPQLDKYWPYLFEGENELAWQYAWVRNGVCSARQFSQRQYFRKALQISADPQYNLLAILEAAGITPSEKKEYFRHEVRGVIASATGKRPGLRCWKNTETNQPQLTRIVLCFKHDGVTLRDCPSSADQDCPLLFHWPTGYTSHLALPTDH